MSDNLPSTMADNYEYAGFWIRVGASVLDTILVLLITIPLSMMVYGSAFLESDQIVLGPADVAINYILPFVAVMAFWIYKAATPGKMAVKAIIVDAKTGQPMTRVQCVIRYFAYLVAMLPLFIGLIWVAWDSKKQGWHDKIAGTVVIRRKAADTESVEFSG